MRTREEQIEDLVDALKKPVCRPDYSVDILRLWLEKHILEAERRAEQRVRAEIGRDSERLDWLSEGGRGLDSYTGVGTYVATKSGEIFVNEDIRVAIDAEREAR